MRDKIQSYLQIAHAEKLSHQTLQTMLGLIDLTRLGDDDTPALITTLCDKAVTLAGQVAAVCVYPQFVAQAKQCLAGKSVKIATVVNFPTGLETAEAIMAAIRQAVSDGAHEIDVVFPYQRYLAGDRMGAQELIRQCRAACGDSVTLKVILETGAIDDLQIISDISHDVILAGADFLKTSTGKIKTGATLPAAAAMLLAIQSLQPHIKRTLGFKVSGGVRQPEQAAQYMALAARIMGQDWITPTTMRVGASQLLDAILQKL